MKLAFRPATSADDLSFVLGTWLDSQRTSYSAGLIPMDRWYDVMRPVYTELLARTDMRCVVAYERDDPDFTYGWIAADPGPQRVPMKDRGVKWWPALVLYCFVKQGYRRVGIARRLFEAAGVDPSKPFLYSSNTVTASRLASKVPHAKFDPLAVRFSKEAA